MDSVSLVVPFLIAVCGVLITVSYILCIAIREMSRQLARMNEMVLLAWKSAGGDVAAGRGLIAKAMQNSTPPAKPKKLDGVASKTEPAKPPLTMKMGSI